MSFSKDVKTNVFIRSARICCLCYKQCGTNIEAAHIKAESEGGPNEEDNAIPLCFDCHQEVGAYDDRHPRGNRFTPAELKARRDQLYKLVETGTIQAQAVASRIQQKVGGSRLTELSAAEIVEELPLPSEPGDDAKYVLRAALEQHTPIDSFPAKVALLNEADRAFVVDTLLSRSDELAAMRPLLVLLSSGGLSENQLVSLEKILRRVTLRGDTTSKALFMNLIPPELLEKVDLGLRAAFFSDLVGIMRRDQFAEVNVVTPAVIKVQSCVPPELRRSYIEALFCQAKSDAYQGAPAARSGLLSLPEELSRIALEYLDRYGLWSNFNEHTRRFVENNRRLWEESQAVMLEDFLTLPMIEFCRKYFSNSHS